MKTVEINKANWTEETSIIELYDDNLSAFIPEYDIRFKLINPRRYTNFTTYSVELYVNMEWMETDWIVKTEHESGYHSASIWNGSYLRESMEDVRYSVAKLIFNIY